MTIEELYTLFLQHPSVQTDTRKLQKGDIFFALSGPNFNGNLFAEQALQLGAAFAVIDEPLESKDERLLLVNDTLNTLQALAKYHRQQFTIPFIAITGSNGKTTTKELVNAVLATHYKTYTTIGNLNNHIGVPLTILSIKPDAEIAVIEMGANHQKEIESYCTYTLPTHGVITNCGKAHLEGFGGIEGVKKGKGELFTFLKLNNGAAFIFNDYDYLQEMSNGISKTYSYGTSNGDIIGNVLQSDPYLNIAISKGLATTIATQLVGEYNLPNVLCAVAIGKYFNVPVEKIKSAIENYLPGNSRSQMIENDGNFIVLDAYNANPTSMKAAIENFAKFPYTQKIVMIGGMMELGTESIAEHEGIVNLLQQYKWQNVILVGGDFAKIKHPFIFFSTAMDAKDWLNNQAFTNTYFLIKGSRSMAMEKILQ
ncbi:MAG: UDP-N-acetylmuramoyl-tripeptide--D-alanyl-D-alanine ligase [Deinococcales bacterium]|nr:UDP-N-acetylmuramoyl-tripeptide--D-alanyl-D-alanine ligase [Chitinophagaceae bacterium]